MKISETIDLCRAEAGWECSAVVAFSWVCFGAALYFMAFQAGLLEFKYHPNEVGVISPSTIASVPKAASTFHFVKRQSNLSTLRKGGALSLEPT